MTDCGCLRAFTATLLSELRKTVEPDNEETFDRTKKCLYDLLKGILLGAL